MSLYFSTPQVKSLDKFHKAERVSDYFSGIILLNENQYEKSFNFLKKLNGLESSHSNYSIKYLYSLINSGNFKEAFNYSRKLEKQGLDSFESELIMGIFYIKNSNFDLAQKFFHKAKTRNAGFFLNDYVANSLYNWSRLSSHDLNQAIDDLDKLDQRFENLKKIQNVFLNCFYKSLNINNSFRELLSNKRIDFSRYNYFYASSMASSGKIKEAKEIINSALKLNPRNVLLNQYKLDLNEANNYKIFDCQNVGHVIAEILYAHQMHYLHSQFIHYQTFI